LNKGRPKPYISAPGKRKRTPTCLGKRNGHLLPTWRGKSHAATRCAWEEMGVPSYGIDATQGKKGKELTPFLQKKKKKHPYKQKGEDRTGKNLRKKKVPFTKKVYHTEKKGEKPGALQKEERRKTPRFEVWGDKPVRTLPGAKKKGRDGAIVSRGERKKEPDVVFVRPVGGEKEEELMKRRERKRFCISSTSTGEKEGSADPQNQGREDAIRFSGRASYFKAGCTFRNRGGGGFAVLHEGRGASFEKCSEGEQLRRGKFLPPA